MNIQIALKSWHLNMEYKMKTITFKADNGFDAILIGLADSLHTTKSGVIRASVINYKKQLERESLAKQVREASFKLRRQSDSISEDLDDAATDGLPETV
jgi:hypothetical protein